MLLEREQERAARVAPNPYGLTAREFHVAAWFGKGFEASAIAAKLSIAPAEVADAMASISTKLGARNAVHLGLIINTIPGLPVEQPSIVAIEDFREAFGMGWRAPAANAGVVFTD
tara:strand:+ start:612 stop:956 length:345 start_codon:yes stop_codon:yes gene_type:complete